MLYVTVAQMKSPALGLPAKALVGITDGEITDAITSASAVADSYLGSRYTLPLVAHGPDLSRAVAHIAAYDLMSGRGFAPSGASPDEQLYLRYKTAIDWLKDVSKGLVTPTGIQDSSGTVDAGSGGVGGAFIVTGQKRGW